MNYPDLDAILILHRRLIQVTGGDPGIHDRGLLESALAQPKMTYDGQDLYTTLHEKAAALGYSLARNHAFVDGNKRVCHAAMELLLRLNGFRLTGGVDEQERVILALASSEMQREEFTTWVINHVQPL